ncbi:MAG: hypothetical protein KAW87_00595 [Candidatus Cloacimonetes bacterium]|nr:hypothetical protein [Candidatus Cloacimonadota bacterium]
MKIENISTSIVLLAKNHHVMGLHPSFLSNENIVPFDWGTTGEIICTPAFSTVNYKNNYSFNIDNNKLQIINKDITLFLEDSKVADLAIKYINRLDYINYYAIGINFTFFIYLENPEKFLIEKFFNLNMLEKFPKKLKKVELKFTCKLDSTILNLNLKSGLLENRNEDITGKGIFIDTNYHYDLKSKNRIEDSKEYLLTYNEKCIHIRETINKVINNGKL